MGSLRAASFLLLLAACGGGGGGTTPAVSPAQLPGKYYGTYNDPDGVPREAWLQIEAEPDVLGRYRTILTIYPESERFRALPASVGAASVVGASFLDGAVLRFATAGANSVWAFGGTTLLQPADGSVAPSSPDYIDASFPQKLSAQAATIEPTTVVQRTYSVPGFTLHLQIVVPPPEKSAARLPPVPH